MLLFRFCYLLLAVANGFTFRGHTFRRSAVTTAPFFAVDLNDVGSYGGKKELTTLRSVGNQAIDDTHVVEKESLLWKSPGYRRPLHWVQKVSHLEDTLQFYQSNFNFKVYRHEEFSSGCEATCNGPYGGAWSKTMVGPEPGEGLSFCLELVFNYGVNRYERGNDLRCIAIKSSAFVGNKELIGLDPAGRKFVETPDGHWLNLVDGDAATEVASDQRDCIESVALHVTNLASSVKFYSEVLGASVVVNPDGISASCIWKSPSTGKSNGINRSAAQTGIVLFQLDEGKELEFAASQGRFAIETEDGAQEEIAVRARAAEGKGSGRVVHGPVKLEPHREEVLIVRDEDGHEYCFVDARGFQRCVDVSKKQNFVDWDYRKNVHKKASADYIGGKAFGKSITVVEAGTYEELVASTSEDVLFDLYAPWCILCARNKPVYEELASRISEITGNKIVFAVFDGSKTPASLVDSPQLGMMMHWAKTQGFPALFYLRGDDKDVPIEFNGEWTIKGLSSWVNTLSSSPLDLSKMDMTELPEFVFDGDEKLTSHAALSAADDDDDCGNCSL